jgi:two-component system response regulator DevR
MSQKPQSIRILIADDHEVVRMGIRALLQQHAHLHVVAEAATGEEAVELALLHKPDVVVMDVRMPGMLGVEACQKIVQQLPSTRVIMLTSYAEDELLFAAIRAGASGYVLKRIGSDDLIRTIEAVGRGESALDPAMTEAIFRELRHTEKNKEAALFAELTSQEMRVLALIADGLTNRELNLSNRAEAAAFAVQHHIKEHLASE